MATALSPEVWDIIVAQLPPPEPKLVPMIFIDPEYQFGERILISKAVSEKEVFMVMNLTRFLEDVGVAQLHGTNDVHWSLRLRHHRKEAGSCEDCFIRARMLGWDYATDADRAAHAANKSFYMTRVKK